MNKALSLFATMTVMLFSSIVLANNDCEWRFTPYVGIDAEWRHLNFQRGFGDNLFKHNYPQGNIYLGAKLHNYMGIEIGYEAVNRRMHSTDLSVGTMVAGATFSVIVTPQDTLSYISTGKIQGPHFDLIGFLPICEKYQFQLIGMAGLAHLKANFVINSVSFNTIFGNFSFPSSKNFLQKRNVLRLGLGLQHMLKETLGVRAMVKWENTKKFKIHPPEDPFNLISAKNSFIYSLGAFVIF